MKEFTEVYNRTAIKNITAAARRAALVFALSAAVFAGICVTFCVLTALDYVNAYLGCALNTVLTVAFLWYGYLFFKVYSAPVFRRRAFLKYLDNAQPALFSGRLVSVTDGEYYTLSFEGAELFLDKSCKHAFTAGMEYDVYAVNGFVVSFREAAHE